MHGLSWAKRLDVSTHVARGRPQLVQARRHEARQCFQVLRQVAGSEQAPQHAQHGRMTGEEAGRRQAKHALREVLDSRPAHAACW